MLYYKTDKEQFSIPDYMIPESNFDYLIIEHENEYMRLSSKDSLFLRGGIQMNLPFDNFVLSSKSNLDSTKDVFKYKRRHTPFFELFKYEFKPNISKSEVFENQLQWKMFQQMHYSWYNLLKDEFKKSYFENILKTLFEIREKKGNVNPLPEFYFAQFKQPLEDTKVIFVNNEYNESIIPFIKGFGTVPTLFREELKKISKYNRTEYLTSDQLNNIGVLGLNASLTSSLLKKNVYFELWKPFFNNVIQRLEEYFLNPVVFVLVGKQVEYFEQHIKTHHVIKVEHPSKAIKENREWNGEPLFRKINELLNEEIKW